MVDWANKDTISRIRTGNYSYVIFDDFPLDSWFSSHYKSFFGAQETVTVTDKYFKKLSFRHGKPCIFLTNWDARSVWSNQHKNYDDDWISHNVNIVYIDFSLF